jgi:hypothetical protein
MTNCIFIKTVFLILLKIKKGRTVQTSEFCKVNYTGGAIYLYACDENGNNVANPRRHSNLNTVLAELEQDGWEMMSMKWYNAERATYILYRNSISLA